MENFDAFRLWLHRPLVDLGDAPTTPTFIVHAIELDYCSMVESSPRPRIQISMNHSFRSALTNCHRPSGVRCSDVQELPIAPSARSAGRSYVTLWNRWKSYIPKRRVRVCWTLAKLGLFDEILHLVPDISASIITRSEELAALAYLRAWARFKKWDDGEEDSFSAGEFAGLALNAPPGMVRIDAAYEMVRQNAKFIGNVDECERWQAVHMEAINSATGLDDHTRTLMLSRYHRVGAFIPQFRGDAAAVDADMTRAEELARSAEPETILTRR